MAGNAADSPLSKTGFVHNKKVHPAKVYFWQNEKYAWAG
jgi:hypothetical protein